jgi:hypothetical protein
MSECAECGTEKLAVALFFGRTPGWACKCQWATLSKREYRQMFGRGFRRVYLPNVASGGSYSGNSHQRRIQRRATVRQLKAALSEFRAD